MMMLIAGPALALTMLQASITGPTDAFRDCLRTSSDKAAAERVAGDKIEEYLRTSCTAPMGTLTNALVAFGMKNGMGRKAATADAAVTVDDYIASPVDRYKYLFDAAAKRAAPAATPAASPQPPKP